MTSSEAGRVNTLQIVAKHACPRNRFTLSLSLLSHSSVHSTSIHINLDGGFFVKLTVAVARFTKGCRIVDGVERLLQHLVDCRALFDAAIERKYLLLKLPEIICTVGGNIVIEGRTCETRFSLSQQQKQLQQSKMNVLKNRIQMKSRQRKYTCKSEMRFHLVNRSDSTAISNVKIDVVVLLIKMCLEAGTRVMMMA